MGGTITSTLRLAHFRTPTLIGIGICGITDSRFLWACGIGIRNTMFVIRHFIDR